MRVAALLLLAASSCTPARQDLGTNLDAAASLDVPGDAGTPSLRITAGRRTTMVLDASGTVWAWGADGNGQLALAPALLPDTCALTIGPTPCATSPVRVPALFGVSDLALGMEHGCALRDGRVMCWGLDLFGMLGDGRTTDDPGPLPIDVGIDDAVAIAVGDWTSCAIHADGGVSCWGLAAAGLLATAPADLASCPVAAAWVARYELPFVAGAVLPCALEPRRVPGLTGVRALALGRVHTCAIVTGDEVVCVGSAESGQLGTGESVGVRLSFSSVLTGASALSAGTHHTCAITFSGTASGLTCWGGDGFGQAGIFPAPVACASNACAPSAIEVDPFGTGTLAALGAGDNHTCAVVGSEAWCFGNADGGAAGARNATCAAGPCRIPAGLVATHVRGPIAGGSEHTCVANLDGTIGCWGEGAGGQLGDGRAISSTVPIRVVLP